MIDSVVLRLCWRVLLLYSYRAAAGLVLSTRVLVIFLVAIWFSKVYVVFYEHSSWLCRHDVHRGV